MSREINKKRDLILKEAIAIIRRHSDEDLSVSVYDEPDNRARLREVVDNEVEGDVLYKSDIYRLIANAHLIDPLDDKVHASTQALSALSDEAIYNSMNRVSDAFGEQAYLGYSDSADFGTQQNKELITMYDYNYGSIKNYVYDGYYLQANRYSVGGELHKGSYNGKKVDEFIASFLNNQETDDLVNGIFSDTCVNSGRPESFGGIPAPDRHNVRIHMTRMLLETVTGECYPLSLIRDMIESKDIHNVPFRHSDHYRKVMAEIEVNNFSDLISSKGEISKVIYNNQELFNELAPNMSEKEKLGILNNQIGNFPKAVAMYKFLTGNSISYDAAFALCNGETLKVDIRNTQAYYDKIDNDFRPDSEATRKYHEIKIDVVDTKTSADGSIDLEIEVETSALAYDELEEKLNEIYKKNISQTINRGDSMYFEYTDLESKKDVTKIKKQIEAAFKSAIKELPLPGDLITIDIDEDNVDWYEGTSIKDGDKHVVVDVVNNYSRGCSLKLKGINTSIESNDVSVLKKLVLKKSLESDLSR